MNTFFVWMCFTHITDAERGQSGMPGNEYTDAMVQHDKDVGKLLDLLDQLKKFYRASTGSGPCLQPQGIGNQRAAAERGQYRWQDLQDAPRRLQSVALPDRTAARKLPS